VPNDKGVKLVDYPVSYWVQRLEQRGPLDNNEIAIRISEETRCYFKLVDRGISIAFLIFIDGNEAIGPKEVVVPANKRWKDLVIVSDELSISDTCKIQWGVNAEYFLFNSCEEWATRKSKRLLQQLSKVLLVSAQPYAKTFQLDEEILPPFSPWNIKLLPNLTGHIKWDWTISNVSEQWAGVTIVVDQVW